ncbi:hypothetical protein B0H10DRAFT_2210562 [Mycena sp. CBHHK59/15]|nr:hypothetical protein B0H10DRAFT_2210562 [Mycena sp. CBHHK59/15]
MKGFDYLDLQGMYNVIKSYGLPSTIIDLDRPAQTDTKCFICTAHGITEPIVITGVTKQGGSLSPVKSTLTTSLGHHYLNDLISIDPDALVITSGNAQKADPHLPDDVVQTTIVMAEATDDSFIFARSLPSLRWSALAMEQFQFAYGWLTQWAKSMVYILEASSITWETLIESVGFDSITNAMGVDPLTIIVHKVKLTFDELDFLRAKVDDPKSRYEELKNLIEDFTPPTSQHHLTHMPTAPILTFFMDEFTFYTTDDGWIESNIRNYTDKSQISMASRNLGASHQQRMSLALYDFKAPPEYPHTSTLILRIPLGKIDDLQCRHGCDAIEDQHHVFVKCKHYGEWRTSAAEDIHTRTNNKLIEKGIKEADCVNLLAIAKAYPEIRPHAREDTRL